MRKNMKNMKKMKPVIENRLYKVTIKVDANGWRRENENDFLKRLDNVLPKIDSIITLYQSNVSLRREFSEREGNDFIVNLGFESNYSNIGRNGVEADARTIYNNEENEQTKMWQDSAKIATQIKNLISRHFAVKTVGINFRNYFRKEYNLNTSHRGFVPRLGNFRQLGSRSGERNNDLVPSFRFDTPVFSL